MLLHPEIHLQFLRKFLYALQWHMKNASSGITAPRQRNEGSPLRHRTVTALAAYQLPEVLGCLHSIYLDERWGIGVKKNEMLIRYPQGVPLCCRDTLPQCGVKWCHWKSTRPLETE